MLGKRVQYFVAATTACLLRSLQVDAFAPSYTFSEVNNDNITLSSILEDRAGHIQARIRSGEVPVRGVNLGSWLVAEKWMMAESDVWHDIPGEAASGGEFQAITHSPDREKTYSRFANHQNTFVMEKDIKELADAGVNTVRVPVGYWIMGEDNFDPSGRGDWKVYPKNTLKYLDVLIKEWAYKHNVAVMISIHAAKGSQNGADHSAATAPGKAYWSSYKENIDNTIALAKFLGDRYKSDAAFLGMGLLNEPVFAESDERVLNQFYMDAYKAVRESGNDCILAIMPLLYKQNADNLVGFMEAPQYTNVWVEWHPYFIWGFDKHSADDLINKAIKGDFQKKLNEWNNRPNSNKLFFGEWCLSNTGQFPNPDTPEFQRWAEAQIQVMNQAKGGWTYWSWRVYNDDKEGAYNGWSMRSVLRKPTLKKILLG